jgi:hypothetical protein
MSNVRQIHKEAMAKYKLANAALANHDLVGYRNMLEDAYILEKRAAQLLTDDYESEPTRSVLFRSAASMAIEAGAYSDAIDLLKTALNGNVYDEIKEEVFELLETINEKVSEVYPAIQQEMESLDSLTGIGMVGMLITHNASFIASDDDTKLSQLHEPTPLPILQEHIVNLLRLHEHLKRAYKKYMANLVADKEQVHNCIDRYVQSKHRLLSEAIGKPDTLSIWYAARFFFKLYETLNWLGGDGIRVYLCAYEEEHIEYPMQTCLAMVPTKSLQVYDGGFIHSNIVPEKEPGFATRYQYRPHLLPSAYLSSELVKKRVDNYLYHQYPLLSKAIGKEDTRAVWYSKAFLENILSGMVYFNANGIRLCLGSADAANDFGRTILITVLTQQHNEDIVNLMYSEGDMTQGQAEKNIQGAVVAYFGSSLEFAPESEGG